GPASRRLRRSNPFTILFMCCWAFSSTSFGCRVFDTRNVPDGSSFEFHRGNECASDCARADLGAARSYSSRVFGELAGRVAGDTGAIAVAPDTRGHRRPARHYVSTAGADA